MENKLLFTIFLLIFSLFHFGPRKVELIFDSSVNRTCFSSAHSYELVRSYSSFALLTFIETAPVLVKFSSMICFIRNKYLLNQKSMHIILHRFFQLFCVNPPMNYTTLTPGDQRTTTANDFIEYSLQKNNLFQTLFSKKILKFYFSFYEWVIHPS